MLYMRHAMSHIQPFPRSVSSQTETLYMNQNRSIYRPNNVGDLGMIKKS